MRDNFARQVGLLLATIMTSACSLAAEPFPGQVPDRVAKQPIAGAIVVGQWYTTSSNFADSHTRCSHGESAVSDATGRYHLPAVAGRQQTPPSTWSRRRRI